MKAGPKPLPREAAASLLGLSARRLSPTLRGTPDICVHLLRRPSPACKSPRIKRFRRQTTTKGATRISLCSCNLGGPDAETQLRVRQAPERARQETEERGEEAAEDGRASPRAAGDARRGTAADRPKLSRPCRTGHARVVEDGSQRPRQ